MIQRFNPTLFVYSTVTALVLQGCDGVRYANVATLLVTMGLFFGTLNLGRRPATRGAAAPGVSSEAK